MKKKKYEVDFLCENCQKIVWLKVEYGTTVEEHLNGINRICPKCGCYLIQ